MAQTSMLHVRIDDKLKADAAKTLAHVGLTVSDAVRILLTRVAKEGGLPAGLTDFRKRHLKALAGLFVQVLKLCQKAGLARLGHVTLDGTKVKANASKHKAMSYGRMRTTEALLTAEVRGWLETAEHQDAEEDRRFQTLTGEELPDWVAHKQLLKLKAATG